jgi:hypothetical protein
MRLRSACSRYRKKRCKSDKAHSTRLSTVSKTGSFLVAEWGTTESGREAKFYRLTANGRTQLDTETQSWARLTEIVGMIPQGGTLMNCSQRLTRTRQLEQELDREFRVHFESQVSDKVHSGMSEAEARRTTSVEFRGLDQIKETAAKAAAPSGLL